MSSTDIQARARAVRQERKERYRRREIQKMERHRQFEIIHEETPETGEEPTNCRWFQLGKPPGVSKKRLLIALVVSSLSTILAACFVGLVFNVRAFDKAGGKTDANGDSQNYVEFMVASSMVSLCIVIPRFGVRYFCHPRSRAFDH